MVPFYSEHFESSMGFFKVNIKSSTGSFKTEHLKRNMESFLGD